MNQIMALALLKKKPELRQTRLLTNTIFHLLTRDEGLEAQSLDVNELVSTIVLVFFKKK